ncbi:VirB4-like conjugal transfer ATPase, CD1110 family [Sinanaerobacter sp. ZZT-01]|uniref:VirB4-like conjugal transfer ATPase, CD1110 family n=1 Tax=Sinanaerobacter sp. ZZT-01 TaxID=3111540 RepID=UPI002D770A20|nr:ATP-binding protein [Sinanaerobacter sp. ZZT-01]WRR94239.1 ATP-binding protein [Sinanaerobacter sp. ZZT-01]
MMKWKESKQRAVQHKTKKSTKKKIYTAQKSIPYMESFEDGILQIGKEQYSKTFLCRDIDYQTAQQEEQESLFLKHCAFLNGFDAAVDVQITINNKSINKVTLEQEILLADRNDKLQNYREEYNGVLRKKMTAGKNNIRKEIYMTCSSQAEKQEKARDYFTRLEAEMSGSLKKMGSQMWDLDEQQRLEILHDVYRNGKEGEFGLNPAVVQKRRGISSKDIIAPDGIEFKRDHILLGDKYAQVLFLKDFPSYLTDRVLADLTDHRFNMMLSMHIKPMNPENALKLVRKKLVGMEANKMQKQKKSLMAGYMEAFIPYHLRNALKEAQELLDDIVSKDQKLFFVSIVMLHIADTQEQLKQQREAIEAAARRNLCQIGVLNYQQEDGLTAALPVGKNNLEISRCLTTESTGVFMPYSSQELWHKDGIHYGINAVSGNLIHCNRKLLKTPSGFFFGTPGSGKSFLAKLEMIHVLLNTDDDIIIIDPEREYTKLVQNFGGEVVLISAASKNYINPMDLNENYGDDEDPLLLKSDFVLSLCEVLVGGRDGLSPGQKSIIDRCMRLTYMEMIQHDYDSAYTPTLEDFYCKMKEQKEEEAQDMATALELYAQGNLKVFSHKTNVNVNNRLVCYDTKDLGKQLKSMGMLIVLDAIWNRVAANREKGKRTWLYVDEMYIFFSSEYLAIFFDEVYRRFRKWGGIPTGITQNIAPMMKSTIAQTMISNSEFIVMLNQAASDREALSELLKISDSQLSYVTNSDPGEGLLYTGGSIVPFINKFPKNTQLYRMMTTKVEEVNQPDTEQVWTV